MLARVPRSTRLWLAVLSSVVLGVGLVMVTSGQAASPNGSACTNDNGNHNGFICDSSSNPSDPGNGNGNAFGNDGTPGVGKDQGNDHGDCKHEPDTPGNHLGYVCGPTDNGGGGNPPPVVTGGGGGGGPAATSDVVTVATSNAAPATIPSQGVLGEKVRACASRRSFTVHIQRFGGVKFRSAKITFRGKVLANRKGDKNVKAPIVLKGLPRGTFTVRIRVVTVHGKVIKGTRTYHTCVAKRAPHRPPRI